jgi:hypothetical protein
MLNRLYVFPDPAGPHSANLSFASRFTALLNAIPFLPYAADRSLRQFSAAISDRGS